MHYVLLEERGLVALAGEEARAFLQGLISNDVDKVSPRRAIYAALLTPQGKYLHDFFLAQLDDRLVLDGEAARLADLTRRLNFYKLRAKVTIEAPQPGLKVAALLGEGALEALGLAQEEGSAAAFAGGVVYTDPRLNAMGARAILPETQAAAALEAKGFDRGPADAYDRLRLSHGLPDGSRDLMVERSILLEGGFEELHGVDFEKGCYVGQELTARTKHRALIRKRLFRVEVDGPLPEPGTRVMLGRREAGVMRSGRDRAAIALLRLELVDEARSQGKRLTAGDARITPQKPDWAGF